MRVISGASCLSTCLFLGSLLGVATVTAQETQINHSYAVQVDSARDVGFADTMAAQLRSDGYSPAWVERHEGMHRVLFGRFPSEVEARVYRDFLVDTERIEEDQADVIRLPNQRPEEVTGRFLSIFELTSHPLSAEGLAFDPELCPIGPGGIRPPEAPALPELPEQPDEDLLSEIEQGIDDPARAHQILQIARERSVNPHNGGFHARALAKPIADGSITASQDDRYQAMWLMARTYHAMGWRRAAYRAYTEIDTVASEPRDVARIGVEKAGLAMELCNGREGLGTQEEVRLHCDRVIEAFEDSEDADVQQHVATARLMRAESFHHGGDTEQSVAALRALVTDPTTPMRERGMALYFMGQALRQSDDLAGAMATFQELVDLNVPTADNFPSYNVDERGKSMLVTVCVERGAGYQAGHWFEQMADEYPSSQWLVRNAHEVLRADGVGQEARDRARQVIERASD